MHKLFLLFVILIIVINTHKSKIFLFDNVVGVVLKNTRIFFCFGFFGFFFFSFCLKCLFGFLLFDYCTSFVDDDVVKAI